MISLIAALDRNRAIGRDGAMPWHLPDDLKRFKALTLGKPVLMGRKTALAIGRALPGRPNLVLTRGDTAPFTGQIIVRSLDQALAHYNAALPPLKEFILPAGNRAAAQAHVCRTVARRAERQVVQLGQAEEIGEAPRQYLNRLSDLLFVLARVLNRMNGGDDVYWKSERLARNEAE